MWYEQTCCKKGFKWTRFVCYVVLTLLTFTVLTVNKKVFVWKGLSDTILESNNLKIDSAQLL
jgi:hypothetical protein